MGESKIIVVANQKGGVGKSTLCMLLANFLNKVIHLPVGAIVDTDFQQSVIKKREEDLKTYQGTTMVPPFQVVAYSLENNSQIPEFVRQLRKTGFTYIIDTPGSLYASGVFSFLALADYIICPFDYFSLDLSSTTQFLTCWHGMKDEMKRKADVEIQTTMILLPMAKPVNVGTRKEKDLWDKIKSQFEALYHVAPEIPEAADIGRINTMEITPGQLKVSKEALNYIANLIYNPNKANNDDNEEDE